MRWWSRAIPLVVTAVLVAACVGSAAPSTTHGAATPVATSQASLTASASPTAPPPLANDPDQRFAVDPGVVPAPHWPIQGVDPGNTAPPSPAPDGLIDWSWTWGTLAWSPDGTRLAAAALSQQFGEGQIHLFDRGGHPVGAIPGYAAAWIDDHRLVTLERDPGGAPGATAWRWSADARSSTRIVGAATGLLASSLGAVAIGLTIPGSTSEPGSFAVWSPRGLSAALPGEPAAWSPDGTRLAVLRETPSARVDGSGVVLAATGSVPPAWLEVLDASSLQPVVSFPRPTFDPRTSVLFDPTGSLIATGSFVFDLGRDEAIPLPSANLDEAWTSDDRLILADPDARTVRLWDPATHTLGAPLVPGTRLRTADHRVAIVPPASAGGPFDVLPPGAVTPDGALRAWFPLSNGTDSTPLWLTSTAASP